MEFSLWNYCLNITVIESIYHLLQKCCYCISIALAVYYFLVSGVVWRLWLMLLQLHLKIHWSKLWTWQLITSTGLAINVATKTLNEYCVKLEWIQLCSAVTLHEHCLVTITHRVFNWKLHTYIVQLYLLTCWQQQKQWRLLVSHSHQLQKEQSSNTKTVQLNPNRGITRSSIIL